MCNSTKVYISVEKPSVYLSRPSPQVSLELISNMAAAEERNSAACCEDEYERPRKIPKTLKEKDSGKRLIVVLERASLETVKVVFKP
jgi:precorrin-6B methylase 1